MEPRIDPDFEPMRLRDAIAMYVSLSAFMVALIAACIALPWLSFLVLIPAYFAAGIILNRKCLARITEFHPLYDTVPQIAETKLKFVIFWPLSYGALLAMLAVDRLI